MWSLAVANVRSNLGRLVATLLAIAVGVSFLTAASMFVRSIQNSLGGSIEDAYAEVDVAVTYESTIEDFGGGPGFSSNDIPDDVRRALAELPAVREIAGERLGYTTILTDEIDDGSSSLESGQTVRNWIDGPLATLRIIEGRPPTTRGEVVLDRRTAADEELAVGDELAMSTTTGAVEVEIVGISALADADSVDPTGTVSVADTWIHEIAGDGTVEWTTLLVDVAPALTAAEGVAAVRDATPDTFEVRSGDDFRTDATGTAGELGDTLRPVLQGFAILALFVCSIVIYNTYAVVVAQRSRELALMRAVAATPIQVWLSLCVEGLLVGLLGSALGVLGGAGLTSALLALLDRFGRGVNGIAPSVTPGTVLLGMAAGTVVSLVAVQMPALRGARTAPVEAMREARVEGGALSRFRWITAAILLALGVAGLVTVPNGWVVGLAAVAYVIGIFVAGPALAVLVARASGPLLRRIGMWAQLSTQNLERNPRRTASTSNALVIGVLLVTLVTVGGTILQRWTVAEVQDQSTADAVVATLPGGDIPDPVVAELSAIETARKVVVLRSADVSQDGAPQRLSAASAADLDAIGIKASGGSLSDLGGGVAALGPAGQSSVAFTAPDGTPFELPVTANIEFSLDSLQIGYLVSTETLDSLGLETFDSTAYVLAEPGTSEETAAAVARAVRGYSTLYSYAGNFFADLIDDAFSFLINAINALLGMSVVIALIGIVNTLSLSIFERRHEIGLLRAVGMTRRDVQRMIRLESVQIAVLGTVIGFIAGLSLALLLIRAADIGAPVSFNVGRLALIGALGVLVGVVASIVPTRRASRSGIVEAMRAE